MGPSLLRDDLAQAWTAIEWTPTRLEILSSSNKIDTRMASRAQVRAASLQSTAGRIEYLSSEFTCVAWHHVKRAFNSAADFLANAVMDSKSASTSESTVYASEHTSTPNTRY
ncbi:hypothetical protein FI667_g11751, partial [Globisporangium splendens]